TGRGLAAGRWGVSVGHASETVSGLDEMSDHLLASGVTTGHQEQRGRRPRPGQLPGRSRGTTEIQTAVAEHAGNGGETVGVSEQCTVFEPGVVVEIVGYDPGEGHAEPGVLIPGVGLPALLLREDGVLPLAPGAGGGLPDGEVRVFQEPVVGIYEISVPVGGRHGLPEAF